MPATTESSPGRLLRMTLQVYGNLKNKPEANEAFSRDYLAKVASIHARNGIFMYQQVVHPYISLEVFPLSTKADKIFP